jgi:Protein of unknown function (DUF4058)
MPSPFPGMNPYLEAPQSWTGLHNWLVGELAKVLGTMLPENYYVAVEERVYESMEAESTLIGIPDSAVLKTPSAQSALGNTATLSQPRLSQPATVTVPMPITINEAYLEVRAAETHQVVTVIEVISLKNKQGESRQKYEEKRNRILASQSHLVEIDLLRKGRAMAFSGTAPVHYRILVSRRQQRPQADLYGFNLQDEIPIFPIPLQHQDAEIPIDLKPIIDLIYDLGRFPLRIDYTQDPPEPKLSKDDRNWCDRLLKQNHLRSVE